MIDPTHCACCKKALTDAVSVNRGIGPICSAKYYDPPPQAAEDFAATGRELLASKLPQFKDLGERMSVAGDHFEYCQDLATSLEIVGEFNSRSIANKLVKLIALHRDEDFTIPLAKALTSLGYKNLSEVICKRIGRRRMRSYEQERVVREVHITREFGYLYVYAPFSDAFNAFRRSIGRWNGEKRAHVFPLSARVELWGALKEHYNDAVLYVDGALVGSISS